MEGKPQVSRPFCPGRGRGNLPRSAERNSSLDFKRKTSRPLGANTLTQFEYPAQPVQRKEPPRQGERACGSSSTPLSRCREKGCRLLGANRLCGSCTPVSRCRIEKKPIFNRKICGNLLGLIAHPIYICYNKQ